MPNHKPYIDWIVSEETLTALETQALQEHLLTCEACARLSKQWDLAESLFAAPAMVEPRTGFVGRWKARAASRQTQPNFQRTWYLLAATGIGGVLIVLGGFFANGVTASELLSAGRVVAASAFANMEEAIQTLNLFSATVGQSISPIIWIGGAALLVLISVVWLLLLRYFASRDDCD
jgi:hypothetical protein